MGITEPYTKARMTPRPPAVAVALLAAGVALGYWLGTSHSGVSEHIGDAYSTEFQIGIETGDWTYQVPLDVAWTDAEGVWHSGSRPECLPPSGAVLGIQFAAVPVKARGIGFRQVVAVFCD